MKKYIAILILIPFVLVATKCTTVHYEHDAAARRLLVTLDRLPLPEGSRVIFEESAVGGSFSGTGDMTNIAAMRAFTTDRPFQDVAAFFAPEFQRDSAKADFGVFPIDQPPVLPELPFDLKSLPHVEKGRTYVLYAIAPCEGEEEGIWDVRGW